MKIVHKNCLRGYLSNWRVATDVKALATGKRPSGAVMPQASHSLARHEYSLCLMLELLDECLTRFQSTLSNERPEFGGYSEAMAFLDVIYLLSRMRLDSAAGIVRYFYECNEKIELPKSFNNLFNKSAKGELPDGLNAVFLGCEMWFPRLKDRRDDIVHHYETYFIGFEQNSGGEMTATQFSFRKNSHAIPGEDLRSYIGGVMAGYQRFLDALLDHLDKTFLRWYGFTTSINSRQATIFEGRSGNTLWWAYKYGGFRHDSLVVYES